MSLHLEQLLSGVVRGAAVRRPFLLGAQALLCLVIAGLADSTRHNFRLGALNLLLLKDVHGPLQAALLQGGLAEEALELHVRLCASLNLWVEPSWVCHGDNLLVGGQTTRQLLVLMLLVLLIHLGEDCCSGSRFAVVLNIVGCSCGGNVAKLGI